LFSPGATAAKIENALPGRPAIPGNPGFEGNIGEPRDQAVRQIHETVDTYEIQFAVACKGRAPDYRAIRAAYRIRHKRGGGAAFEAVTMRQNRRRVGGGGGQSEIVKLPTVPFAPEASSDSLITCGPAVRPKLLLVRVRHVCHPPESELVIGPVLSTPSNST